MKKTPFIFLAIITISIFACNKSATPENNPDTPYIKSIKEKLTEEGFSTYNLIEVDNGFIVEGDIFIPKDHFANYTNGLEKINATNGLEKINATNGLEKINATSGLGKTNAANVSANNKKTFMAGAIEQYRVYNTISVYMMPGVSADRNIYVSVDGTLPEPYITATDSAINRYNNAGLAFNLVRLGPGSADIELKGSTLPAGVFALSSFPGDNGNPYQSIQLNVNLLGNAPDIGYLATVIAHEIGHCIGLRHTNYKNPNYDCKYAMPSTSGIADDLTAIPIPGTSPDADANSYMLACFNGVNRPFTKNDLVALNYLYGKFGSGEDGAFYQDSLTSNTYVIMEGAPRKIASPDIIKSLFGTGANLNAQFAPMDLPYGTSIMDGSGISVSQPSGKIYFIDNSSPGNMQKRLINSSDILRAYYFNEAYFNYMADELLNSYPTGTPLTVTGENGRFVRDGSTGAVFVAMDNKLRQLNTLNVIYNVFTMNSDHIPNIVNFQKRGPEILAGSKLVKTGKAGDVYFIDVHKNKAGATVSEKRHLYNMDIFNRYHFSLSAIQTISETTINGYANGTPLN